MSKTEVNYDAIVAGLEYWTGLDEQGFSEAADALFEKTPILSGYMLSVGDELKTEDSRMLFFYYCVLADAFLKLSPVAAIVSQREIDNEEARLHKISAEMERADEHRLNEILREEQKHQPEIFEFMTALLEDDPDEEIYSPFSEESKGTVYATLTLAVHCMHRAVSGGVKMTQK